MSRITMDSIPDVHTEGVSVTEVPVSGTDCGEVQAAPNFRLFEVLLGAEPEKQTTVHVRQEPLPPGEQGDFFAVYTPDNTAVFSGVAIETRYASGADTESLIARVAIIASYMQD